MRVILYRSLARPGASPACSTSVAAHYLRSLAESHKSCPINKLPPCRAAFRNLAEATAKPHGRETAKTMEVEPKEREVGLGEMRTSTGNAGSDLLERRTPAFMPFPLARHGDYTSGFVDLGACNGLVGRGPAVEKSRAQCGR
jgi:hypothetical protein